MVLNIYLIRHAETDFNKKNSGFLQSEEMEINSYGAKQLKNLSIRLKKIKLDRVYSSDLLRTRQTAEILFANDRIIFDKRLREYEHGSVMPGTEKWAKEYNELLNQGYPKEDIRPYGGENIWDLIKRVKSFIGDIEKLDGNIAIVSHSGTNETFINLSQRLKKENFVQLKQDNTCFNHLTFDGEKWEIKTMNDVLHINDLRPDIEYYEDIEEVYKKLDELLESKNISLNDFKIIDLSDNKIGRYKRVFMRYFGTPIKLIIKNPGEISIKGLKVTHIYEDYKEYELGKVVINDTQYKVCLIDPKKSS